MKTGAIEFALCKQREMIMAKWRKHDVPPGSYRLWFRKNNPWNWFRFRGRGMTPEVLCITGHKPGI